MIITGSWVGTEEVDLYIWIRRFESEEERQRLYEAVYQNDYWLNEAKPLVDEMLDREQGLVVTLMEASPRLIIR